MMQEVRDRSGLAAWALIIGVSVFIATKHLWFDAMTKGEKATFWVNLAVALGTLALAAVTWYNVRQTTAVIAAEDRRLQQSLAPLLLLRFSLIANPVEVLFDGVTISNHGKGLARDIYIIIHYFNGQYVRLERGHERVWQRTHDDPEELTARIDAITENAHRKNYLGINSDEDGTWDVSCVRFTDMSLTYLDMFGNRYQTLYDGPDSYKWMPPPHLRINSAHPREA